MADREAQLEYVADVDGYVIRWPRAGETKLSPMASWAMLSSLSDEGLAEFEQTLAVFAAVREMMAPVWMRSSRAKGPRNERARPVGDPADADPDRR